jgi:hypothetical protein
MTYNLIFPAITSNYNEISQGSDTKFSGIVRTGTNEFTECFTPAKCRDYLGDSFSYRRVADVLNYSDSAFKQMSQYGFCISKAADPLWTVSPDNFVYLKVQSHEAKELDSIVKYLPMLNVFMKEHSKFLGKAIRIMTRGTITKEHFSNVKEGHFWSTYCNHVTTNEVGYLILKFHKNWFSSAPAISLSTLLVRILAWGWRVDQFNSVQVVNMEQFIHCIKTGNYSNESDYCKTFFNNSSVWNWKLAFEQWHNISNTMTNLMSVEHADQCDSDIYYYDYCDTLHNNSGIIAFKTACANSVNQGFKNYSDCVQSMDNVMYLVAAKYQHVLNQELAKGAKSKYWNDLKVTMPVWFDNSGEIKWEKVKKVDLWATARAKYADLPTL